MDDAGMSLSAILDLGVPNTRSSNCLGDGLHCGTFLQPNSEQALECPARFVPAEMRQTGTRGAGYGARKEAYGGADCEPFTAG
jgi:hypothetical protein